MSTRPQRVFVVLEALVGVLLLAAVAVYAVITEWSWTPRIVCAATALSVFVFHWPRRLLAGWAEVRRWSDFAGRDYTLYLRSFIYDAARVYGEDRTVSVAAEDAILRQLSRLARPLKVRDKDNLNYNDHLGVTLTDDEVEASVDYFDRELAARFAGEQLEDWQKIVATLIHRAKQIVLCPGSSDGVMWELEAIIALERSSRCLLVFPPLPAATPWPSLARRLSSNDRPRHPRWLKLVRNRWLRNIDEQWRLVKNEVAALRARRPHPMLDALLSADCQAHVGIYPTPEGSHLPHPRDPIHMSGEPPRPSEDRWVWNADLAALFELGSQLPANDRLRPMLGLWWELAPIVGLGLIGRLSLATLEPALDLVLLALLLPPTIYAYVRERDWRTRAIVLGDEHRFVLFDYAISISLTILAVV